MTMAPGAFLQIGDIIAGKYRVESILGQGGMGVVVSARHIELGERRAIKFMLPESVQDAEAVERFRREARAAGRLKSPGIVAIYDIDRLSTGELYMVMERLEGEDLKSLVEKRRLLPLEEACHYARQAALALAEAHAAGIVHRDIKLANLFLARDERGERHIKVLDFGIAKIAESPSDPALTRTREYLGSPAFMSPEQIRAAKSADARTDIWSLGVVLYKLTTGVFPFEARGVNEVFANVLSSKPAVAPSTSNAALPPAFDALVLHCLEKNRDSRLSSMALLASALEPFASSFRPSAFEESDSLDGPTQKLPSMSGPGKQPFSVPVVLFGVPESRYSPAELAAIPADPNLSASALAPPTSVALFVAPAMSAPGASGDIAPNATVEKPMDDTADATTARWNRVEKKPVAANTLRAAESPGRRRALRTVMLDPMQPAKPAVEEAAAPEPRGRTIPNVYLVAASVVIGAIVGAIAIFWFLERNAPTRVETQVEGAPSEKAPAGAGTGASALP